MIKKFKILQYPVDVYSKINEIIDHLNKGERKQDEAYLGLATTEELLNEIKTRLEVEGLLSYRTVDEQK